MTPPVITYEPDNSLKKGWFAILGEIGTELSRNRWLTYQLFKRDFLATYKQSIIGISWAFLIPLISVGAFIILNRSGIFSTGAITVPYPIYAVLGIAFWQLFSTGVILSSNALVKAGSMIVKINFSKKSLVIASYAQSFIPLLVQLCLVAILCAVYRVAPSLKVVMLPFALMPVIIFSFGLGLFFSLINAVLRDIGNILSVAITFLMFLTPILYAEPSTGILADITHYNPLYYLIAAPRDIFISGTIVHIKGFIVSTIISVLIFIVSLIVFHITEVRIAERI